MKIFLAFLIFILPLFSHALQQSPSAKVTTQTEFSASTTSAVALDSDNQRHYLLVVNKGTDVVYLKFDSLSTGTDGIPLPAGAVYEPWVVPTNSLYIKAASGTQTVLVLVGK